jgi:hypothetical protein
VALRVRGVSGRRAAGVVGDGGAACAVREVGARLGFGGFLSGGLAGCAIGFPGSPRGESATKRKRVLPFSCVSAHCSGGVEGRRRESRERRVGCSATRIRLRKWGAHHPAREEVTARRSLTGGSRRVSRGPHVPRGFVRGPPPSAARHHPALHVSIRRLVISLHARQNRTRHARCRRDSTATGVGPSCHRSTQIIFASV